MVINMKPTITEYGTYKGNHLYLFLLKNIIKDIIKKICYPFVYLYYTFKFHNIWNLKEYLEKNNKQGGLLTSFYLNYFNKRSSFIGQHTKLSDIPCFPHGLYGIFISEQATIGKNCVIFHHVTIGANTIIGSKSYGYPTIGDNVYIGCGAKIIGGIHIGNNCRIGAGAIVTEDMKDNTVAVASPTRFIQKKNLDNRFTFKGKNDYFYYKDGEFVKLEKEEN